MECDDSLYAFEDELGVKYEDYPYVAEESWVSRLFSSLVEAFPRSDVSLLKEMLEKRNGEVRAYAG